MASYVYNPLTNQGFKETTIKKESSQNYSGLIIEEGSLDKRTATQRNRSKKLREIAINEFKKQHEGQLFCVVCGFNFLKKYGKLGKDFIEIHHGQPIHLMDIEGERVKLCEALKTIFTVCSNCHRMIHHGSVMLSIDEVKALFAKNNDA